MDKNSFKDFCEKELEKRGFFKNKKLFYLYGDEILCAVGLQKSSYGDIYYLNFYFYIGSFKGKTDFPSIYEYDIHSRVLVMSKKSTIRGNCFMTSQIEYTEYTEEELRSYFDKEFEERILPPIYKGKKYIIDNLGHYYYLTLRKDDVLKKLEITE